MREKTFQSRFTGWYFIADCYFYMGENMIENDMKKFLEAIEKFSKHIYEITEIFIANPMDLIEIDMHEIPSNYYFISNYHIDKGTMYKVEDGELKKALYELIKGYHPDRVFRGKKL